MQYLSFVYVPDIDACEPGIIELIKNIALTSINGSRNTRGHMLPNCD